MTLLHTVYVRDHVQAFIVKFAGYYSNFFSLIAVFLSQESNVSPLSCKDFWQSCAKF